MKEGGSTIRSVSIFNVSCSFVLPQSDVITSGMVQAKLPEIDLSGSITCIAVEWQ